MAFPATVSVATLNGENGLALNGQSGFDGLGAALALIDLDGDGFDDLVVSHPGAPGGAAAYVIWGAASGLPATLNAGAVTGAAGFRLNTGSNPFLANIGDFNGDGKDDLLIGTPATDRATVLFAGAIARPSGATDLATLAAGRSVVIQGPTGDAAGNGVGVGDVNGDGFADILIGASGDDAQGPNAGAAYLVFGRAGAAGPISLATLNGQTGFRMDAAAAGGLGGRLTGLGDINGDGFADFAIGAPSRANNLGSVFVVFGKASGLPAQLDLNALTGANGFRIDGKTTSFGGGLGANLGPAGDLNGDGLADFVVGTTENNPNGAAYVIFGTAAARPAVFDLNTLNGANGFRIAPTVGQVALGAMALTTVGDVNGDGFDDLLVGDFRGPLNDNAGTAFVLYGRSTFAAEFTITTVDGVSGFRLNGTVNGGALGLPATWGDVNGDGLSDILVGASGITGAPVGHAYLLLGQNGGPATTGADTLTGTAGVDHFNGLAGNDTLNGMAGSDLMRGGPGTDTSIYAAASGSYEWWSRSDGTWRVKDLRAGSPEGTDILTDIEQLQFSDKTVKILGLTTAEKLTDAYSNILRSTAAGSELTFLNGLIASVNGATKTLSAAITEIVAKADQTTAVAAMSYQFFLGFIPSKGGFDYLVSPQGPNPNNINSAYYQSFNIENRYINFAVNLGKVGEGAAGFAAEYGAKTLFQATHDAYAKVFGGTVTDDKIHLILDTTFQIGGATITRADYFALYGGDGLSGIGTKAAMVGWLLTEAAKADVGMYANSSNAFLTDLADGAQTLVDLVGVYGKAEYVFNG